MKNNEVGVIVAAGGIVGATIGISVAVDSKVGVASGGVHPTGVGVWYCPHSDVLPAHEESMEAVRRKIIARFTGGIIPVSLIKPLNTKGTKYTKKIYGKAIRFSTIQPCVLRVTCPDALTGFGVKTHLEI